MHIPSNMETRSLAAARAGELWQIIPETRKGEGIGYFGMSATLATAIGPFIGLYMSHYFNFQSIFSFCLALGVISLLIAFLIRIPTVEISVTTSEEKGFKLSNYFELRALPIAVITMIIAFCYSSVLSYINFYAIEIDLMDTV